MIGLSPSLLAKLAAVVIAARLAQCALTEQQMALAGMRLAEELREQVRLQGGTA